MSRALTLLFVSFTLSACGQADPSSLPSERGPKARANDRPIEREVERRRRVRQERPLAAVEDGAETERPSAPAVEPEAGTEPPSTTTATTVATAATEPVAEPEPAEPALPAEGTLTVARLVATANVEDREPTTAPRADAERTFAFVEAANASDVDTELSVVFVSPDGEPGRPISLRLPVSPRWRTWATTRHTHDQPGAWTVIVRDAAGAELRRERFEVAAAAPAAS